MRKLGFSVATLIALCGLFFSCTANSGGSKDDVQIIDVNPDVVSNLVAENGDGSLTLKWKNPSDEDFDKVVITYSSGGESGSVSVNGFANAQSSYLFDNTKLVSGSVYEFTVKTFDKAGNQSEAVSKTAFFITVKSDALTDNIVDLSGYSGSDGTSANYYKFGDWPQSVAKDGVLFSDNTVKINSYDCFYGSDGYYYVECDENPFDPEFTYSDASDVQYEVDGVKLEPIRWRAVSNDYDFDGSTGSSTATLFVCETILTASVPYYVSQNSRTLGSATIHANNYKYSNIRAFLNGTKNQYVIEGGNSSSDVDWSGKGFLQLAFGSSAQEKIKSTVVDNSALSTADFEGSISTASEYACADTEDKVFILSEYEVTNTSYGFSAYDAKGIGNSRIRKVCDYAIVNYADLKNETGFGGYWLLISPYSAGENVLSIESDGETYVSVETDNLACGIVPAICVSLN